MFCCSVINADDARLAMTMDKKPMDKKPVTSTKKPVAPVDGGCQGWAVVATSFVVHMLISVGFTYGIIVPSLVVHFNCGRSLAGGVGSLMIGVSWIAGASSVGGCIMGCY